MHTTTNISTTPKQLHSTPSHSNRSNVCRTLVTGTAGNPNRLYKHHILLDVCLLWVQHIEPICNSIQPRFQKTPIKPGKTRKFALTSAFWGLRYALDTKIHSNAVLSLCFGEFSPKSALWAARQTAGAGPHSVERD